MHKSDISKWYVKLLIFAGELSILQGSREAREEGNINLPTSTPK
jgi:hypothetical protein